MNKENPKRNNKTRLRRFSWERKEHKDEKESLVEETVLEWYEAKHRKASDKELELINSIQVSACPYCAADKIVKNGHSSEGIQRYKCSMCNGRFTAITGTIFDNRKIPISEWIEYLLHLFEFHSLNTSSFDNRNSSSTGRYWLFKVFAVLKDIQDNVQLSGDVYADELYLPVIKSETYKKEDGNKLNGLSRNKICICCAVDNNGRSIFIQSGRGKPTAEEAWNAYGSHIKLGSTLIHDGENSHSLLIEHLNMKSIVYTTKETKGKEDKDNPLDPINRQHALLKRFIKMHGGYNRENAQDWLNLFWFIVNAPEDKYDKVTKFIDMALKTNNVVRYRESMKGNE